MFSGQLSRIKHSQSHAPSSSSHGGGLDINAVFNGLDRPGPAVLISSARVIGVNVPVAWLGGAMFGAPGVFIGISAANLLVAALGTSWLSTVVHDRVALRPSPT